MATKIDGPRTRSRKLWDKHGSLLILIVVSGLAFNGGTEWQAYKDQRMVEALIVSHTNERDDLRTRLRTVNNELRELSKQMAPAVDKAATASKEATEAVQKADQTIDKASKLIEATNDSDSRRSE